MCRSKYASACCLSAHPRPFTPRQQPSTIPFSVSPYPPSLALLGLHACLPLHHSPSLFPIASCFSLTLPFLSFVCLLCNLSPFFMVALSLSRCLPFPSLAFPVPYRLLLFLMIVLSFYAFLSFPSFASPILYRLLPFLMHALFYALAFPFLWFHSPCKYACFLPSYATTTANSSSFFDHYYLSFDFLHPRKPHHHLNQQPISHASIITSLSLSPLPLPP